MSLQETADSKSEPLWHLQEKNHHINNLTRKKKLENLQLFKIVEAVLEKGVILQHEVPNSVQYKQTRFMKRKTATIAQTPGWISCQRYQVTNS